MSDVIIFGMGQDGTYMSELCRSKDLTVKTCTRDRGNVRDSGLVTKMIKSKPKFIFNFAAESRTSHDAILENQKTICDGTLNILEAVRTHSPSTKVFLSGSGLQLFQKSADPFPLLCEGDELCIHYSPYVVQRDFSLNLARYYAYNFGLKVYFGFLFGHDSPLRKLTHVSQQIAHAAKLGEKIEVKNWNVVKEWTHAGDIVSGIFAFVNQDEFTICCIGSGEGHNIAEYAQLCYAFKGLDAREYVTQRNEDCERMHLVCNPARLKSFGWEPKVTFPELAAQMMSMEI